jgi:predicted DsbA family dithiol-disulfide isomerase
MPDPKGEYLREHWTNRVYPLAEERGLTMRLPSLQTRTRRAHEAAAFARAHGRMAAVDTGLYRAFFEHGRDIDDLAVLEDVAREAGLDPAAMRMALESGAFAAAVDADRQLAATLGIRSVPTMLVGETLDDAEPVVGAVPYEWLAGAIDRALFGDRSQARLRRRLVPQLRVIE